MSKKKIIEPRMQIFDTHQHIKDLQSAGFNQNQAETVVKCLLQSKETDFSYLATKEQVEIISRDIKAEINHFDNKIEVSVAKLEVKISELQTTTLKWMVGTMFALCGFMIALIKLIIIGF